MNNRASVEGNKIAFTYRHGGDLKLTTLREGEHVILETGGPTDEGYHNTETVYEYKDGVLTKYFTSESRDCDGRHSNSSTSIAKLNSKPDVTGYDIEWISESEFQRDHTAEASGY